MVGGLSITEEQWLSIAQLCSTSTERNLLFHLITRSVCPFQIHYKVDLLWLWASEKPMLMTLHRLLHPNLACLFLKLFFIFNFYFFSCCSFFFLLFCIVGSGYSPLEDDEDVYARSRYKGECFAYVLKRINCLLTESFILFSFHGLYNLGDPAPCFFSWIFRSRFNFCCF